MTGTRSSVFPARSDGFDNVDGGPECGVYIQMRGIEQVRIRRGFQWGDGPLHVALVPAQDVGQDVGLRYRSAGGAEFERPAAGPHLRRRSDEDFHIGIGENHRSDVAAVEHRARRGTAEIALEGE